jgi:hypothetical protein
MGLAVLCRAGCSPNFIAIVTRRPISQLILLSNFFY